MFREISVDRATSGVAASEGALRHADGSINFEAYRERARLARAAAITASLRGALALVSGVFAGKPAPATRHHAT